MNDNILPSETHMSAAKLMKDLVPRRCTTVVVVKSARGILSKRITIGFATSFATRVARTKYMRVYTHCFGWT